MCQWGSRIIVLQVEALGRIQDFMQWLTQLCCDSLYPGAAHARCHFAIHCLQVVLLCYKDDGWLHHPMHATGSSKGCSTRNLEVQKKFRQDPEMMQQMTNGDKASAQLQFDPLAPCIRSSESFVRVRAPRMLPFCFAVLLLCVVYCTVLVLTCCFSSKAALLFSNFRFICYMRLMSMLPSGCLCDLAGGARMCC